MRILRSHIVLVVTLVTLVMNNNCFAQVKNKSGIYGQPSKPNFMIHGSVMPLLFMNAAHVFGEYIHGQGDYRFGANVGYGGYAHVMIGYGTNTVVNAVALIKKVEIGVGYLRMQEREPTYTHNTYSINCGIRKYKKHSMFRIGIGFPEGFYLGYGVGF